MFPKAAVQDIINAEPHDWMRHMGRILITLVIFGVLIAGFVSGHNAGKREAERGDYLERAVLRHIQPAQGETADGRPLLSLAYFCAGQVIAYRVVGGGTPFIDPSFEPRRTAFLTAAFNDYWGYLAAAAGGGLTSRFTGRGLRRLIVKPGSRASGRLIAMIVAGVSGNYLGYQYGVRRRPRCDSPDALSQVRNPAIWDQAEAGIVFRLLQDNMFMERNRANAPFRASAGSPPGALHGLSSRPSAALTELVTRKRSQSVMRRLLEQNAVLTEETKSTADTFFDYFFLVFWILAAGAVAVFGGWFVKQWRNAHGSAGDRPA